MPPFLYTASVPVFLRFLDRLLGLIDAAESHVRSGTPMASEILQTRLAPDMLPFASQVEIAANFALRACFPLCGAAVPPYGEFAASFDGLRARIAYAGALLQALEAAQFAGAETRVLESQAGDAVVSLQAPEFLMYYALPNFFFHLTCAYAILRSCGVAVGKAHFDGYHSYPPSHHEHT